jgi:DNA-binding MarR family transcriptional regulator
MQTNGQMNGQSTLGFLLADASRLLRRRFQQESRDLPMTGAQLKIIARLAHAEGLSQAALAGLLDLEPMTLSRHVDRMEAAGLIERRPDPNDRRARQLFTTEKSRELLQPMRARAAAVYDSVLAGMSEAERQALIDALNTIIANLAAGEPGAAAEETDRDRKTAYPTAQRKTA